MQQLLQLFENYPQLAWALSLTASILVALLGLIPSVFITTANILYFGFWPGTLVSFAGEVLGAILAFYLYRKGFKNAALKNLNRYKKVAPLLHATGKKAFSLILVLRLLPFIPSGIVTLVAAVGRVSAPNFLAASSLGKIPSLLIEAYSVNEVLSLSWQGKIIIALTLVLLLILIVRSLIKAQTPPA